MTNYRLTFRYDPAEDLDDASLPIRLRTAAPIGLSLTGAYLDATELVVYAETDRDADQLIGAFAERLGLGPCSTCAVRAVPVADDEMPPAPITTDLASLRRAEVTGVTATSEGRTLSVKVRHKPFEQIDRVEVKEADDTVGLAVWVGSPDDDARRHYVTLGEAFSTATVRLDRPLGTRHIIELQ